MKPGPALWLSLCRVWASADAQRWLSAYRTSTWLVDSNQQWSTGELDHATTTHKSDVPYADFTEVYLHEIALKTFSSKHKFMRVTHMMKMI